MKSHGLVVLIGTISLVGLVQAVNYCSPALMCGSSVNIGCNNTGNFVSTCPSGRVMVNMTTTLKQAIVKRHNTLRNTLAASKLKGFNPATRMATMKWDSSLAALAALNVKRCVFSHDACHNTVNFSWSGQNIAETAWSNGPAPTDISVILPQIGAWWSENANTTMADINSYPSNPKAVIGHFTVMTAAKNIALGCAGAKYRDPVFNNWNSLTFACNYARTNIIGARFYVSGPTASKCSTGTNPNFPALCSLKEKFAVNVV